MSTLNTESVDLEYLDEQFAETPEATVGAVVPDGPYVVRIESVDLVTSQTSGNLMLKWVMVITDGEYAGKSLHHNNMMQTAQNLGFLKRDLGVFGVPVNEPGFKLSQFVNSQLTSLMDTVVQVNARTKPDASGQPRTNVYFNQVIEGEVDSGNGAVDSGVITDPTDPFANE